MKYPLSNTNIDDSDIISKSQPSKAHVCMVRPSITNYHYDTQSIPRVDLQGTKVWNGAVPL